MSQVHGINYKRDQPYECGATLLTVLAIPEDDDRRRQELHATLCAYALHKRFEANPDDTTPIWVKPIHAFRPDTQVTKEVSTFNRLLRKRLVAGRMAYPYLQEAILGRPPRLPEGVERLSINQIGAFMIDYVEADPSNLETRTWRPSRSVLHLAAAMAGVIDGLQKAGWRLVAVEEFLWNQTLVEAIVREAEQNEERLATSRLRIDPARLVKVRLV